MSTASNEITQLPFVYDSRIRVGFFQSLPIPWFSGTSPRIRITAHKAAKTPNIRKPKSVTVVSIPHDTQIAGWRLKSLLLVQLTPARRELVAETWLEGLAEYGTAENEADAITDLVVSLGEYGEALESREKNLGDSARKELDYLRRLIERSS